jgi:hypothetical protein
VEGVVLATLVEDGPALAVELQLEQEELVHQTDWQDVVLLPKEQSALPQVFKHLQKALEFGEVS